MIPAAFLKIIKLEMICNLHADQFMTWNLTLKFKISIQIKDSLR